jgi:hypothetical protein
MATYRTPQHVGGLVAGWRPSATPLDWQAPTCLIPFDESDTRRRSNQCAQFGLTTRYRIVKARVFVSCILAALAGFFIPWLVLKALP